MTAPRGFGGLSESYREKESNMNELQRLQEETEELKRLNAVYWNAYETMASIADYYRAYAECDCPTRRDGTIIKHNPGCIELRAQRAFEEYRRIKGGDA